MSHIVVNKIRSLPIKGSAKCVLWVLADIADDQGQTGSWASLPRLETETGLSRRCIIDAIKSLEQCGVLLSDRSNGRQTSYLIQPESFNSDAQSLSVRSVNRAANLSKPVQMPHGCGSSTSANNVIEPVQMPPEPVQMPPEPVQMPHSIHLIPHIPQKHPTRNDEKSVLEGWSVADEVLPEFLNLDAWTGYLEMRKIIKKPLNTQHGFKLIMGELIKFNGQGFNTTEILNTSVMNQWCGVFAPKQSPVIPIAQEQTKPNNTYKICGVPIAEVLAHKQPWEDEETCARRLKSNFVSTGKYHGGAA
ncbi:MAG: helix-turn-helix domain-containing protein [Moraxellaceae bacterium]